MVQGAPPALGAGLAEFDSRVPDRDCEVMAAGGAPNPAANDCDAREQVNAARRERVLDGIVTRASPKIAA